MQATQTLTEKRSTAHGYYWRARAARPALLSHVRGLATTHFKSASIGGDQESGFEQAFSSLAYAYMKDKSPRLLDFIVGFQLIDRNEDNTKAVGIFGFKVGDQWLYGPTFFLNGDLKGHELLYIKKQDAFVPMKENWVNYLIAKKPHTLGEGSDKNTFELGGQMPNLSRLARPPSVSKYGSDLPMPVEVQSWARPFLPFAMALATEQARALYPESVKTAAALNFKAVVDAPFKAAFAPFAEKFDMRNVLSDFPMLKAAFEKCYQAYPLIKKGFDRFYGPGFFGEMAGALKADADSLVTKAATYPGCGMYKKRKKRKKAAGDLFDEIVERQGGVTGRGPGLVPRRPVVPFDKNAGLTIFALDVNEDEPGTVTENKKELTDEERGRLLRDTVLIKDERKDASVAYNTQLRQELVNPAETGLYDVLEKPGTFTRMLAVMHPHTHKGRKTFCTLVSVGDKPAKFLNTHGTNIWAKAQRSTDEFRTWYDGLPKIDGDGKLKKDKFYVVLGELGSGSAPFKVQEDFGDGVYKIDFKDFPQYNKDRPVYLPYSDPPNNDDQVLGRHSWETDAKLRVVRGDGNGIRCMAGGDLIVPRNLRYIEVAGPKPKPEEEFEDASPTVKLLELLPIEDQAERKKRDTYINKDQFSSEDRPIQPGDLADVQIMLQKEAHQLRILDTGGEVWVKSGGAHGRMTKKAALIGLVRDHGLREEQARLMLKEAAACGARNLHAAYWVKYAYGYGPNSLQPGPDAPGMPEPMRGVEQNGPNAVSSIYPQEEEYPVDSMSSQGTDPAIYDPFYQPDQQSMQVAQQAANSGQKEVFDTAMLSGMLKSMRQETQVDKYLGDLMKALDKLGRILFMFYWHQEEFEDRYGKQDLPELEDSLRNSFEVLGDVVLFLKEKTVQGQKGLETGESVGPGSAEPDITEAARN
jgi:hypothetical protein